MHNPTDTRISVITVNLNNGAGLEKTIRSVISQRNVSVEYIVIDGGSVDGSREIIKEYEPQIATWISERDCGPYDAMNKGIGLAKGEWISFMNSGDVFYSPDSLAGIIQHLRKDVFDAVYGDSLADYGNFKVYRKARPFEELWKGMVFSHQALLLRASILKIERFDTSYTKIADYDLVIRCLPDPGRVRYEPVPLVICNAFGISNKGQASVLRDYYRRAGQSLVLGFGRKWYYMKNYLILSVIDLLKLLLPGRFIIFLIRLSRMNLISGS
jgi:putative colanic acid biosynthesis glycosyltransferase